MPSYLHPPINSYSITALPKGFHLYKDFTALKSSLFSKYYVLNFGIIFGVPNGGKNNFFLVGNDHHLHVICGICLPSIVYCSTLGLYLWKFSFVEPNFFLFYSYTFLFFYSFIHLNLTGEKNRSICKKIGLE